MFEHKSTDAWSNQGDASIQDEHTEITIDANRRAQLGQKGSMSG